MRTKRFNPEDFERYDNPARVRTQQHLELTGYTVEPHPDRYAQDLIATKDGTSIYVECEVKVVWSGVQGRILLPDTSGFNQHSKGED